MQFQSACLLPHTFQSKDRSGSAIRLLQILLSQQKSHPFWMVSGRSGAALPKLLFRNWSAWSCSSGAPGACDENCPAKGGFYFGRALGRREGSVIYIKVDLPWPVTDPMDLNFSVTCLGLFFRWTIHYDLQDCPFRLIKSSSFDRAV